MASYGDYGAGGTGRGSDADEELTYWEEKYGGWSGSSSSSVYGGGPPPSVLDGSAFLMTYNNTDRGVRTNEKQKTALNLTSVRTVRISYTEY